MTPIIAGMLYVCGAIGLITVRAEQQDFCPVALNVTTKALLGQRPPTGVWSVNFVRDYADDGYGNLMRGWTVPKQRRIYVVAAEPRTVFHELHHARAVDAGGSWTCETSHCAASWTCQDWVDELNFTGQEPTWANGCNVPMQTTYGQ